MASPLSSRSTPNIPPSSAVSHTSSSTVVNAPIEHVWNVLLDTSTWPAWNTFCPRVTIRAQPSGDSSPQEQPLSTTLRNGTQMTFHVHMNRDSAKETATQLIVTEFEPPSSTTGATSDASTTTTSASSTRRARITWVVDPSVKRALPLFLLNAERVHELVEIEVDAAEGPSGGTTTNPTTTTATAGHSAGVTRRRRTEVRTWEAQTGWLAYVVRWLYGARLREAFRDWVEDLKRFVEEEAEEVKRRSQ